MPNAKKIEKVTEISQKLQAAKSAALLQYQGLTALDISDLRDKVKDKGGVIEVTKNSLISRGLEKIGIKLPEILTGPTAVVYSNTDEIAPLKEIDRVNEEKKLTSFKYGVFDGQLLSLDQLKKFLSLPSKSQLVAQFIGGLQNPLQRLAYALRFNQTQLVLTLKAIAEKRQ